MPDWLQAALGGVLGLLLIGGVFWFAFRSPPERRSDGGMTQNDASDFTSGEDGGGHSH